MKRIFAAFIALVFFTTANLSGQTVNKNLIDGEIYVKYHDNFPVDFSVEFAEPHILPGLNPELVAQYGIVQARFSFNKTTSIQLQKTVRIRFTAIDKAEELINYFAKQPFVEYAEGVPAVYPTHTPNDLGSNSVNSAWHLYKINAQEAWDLCKGDSTIRVAVVDQEFDINHPDLKDNVWKNPGEIPNNGKDDDNNGYVDDITGWDMADNDNDVICNTNGFLDHGTPCAGLVAATTNNGIGVSSIGYNISFIPIKVCQNNQNSKGLLYSYEGIAYAALMKADIISCSFGGASFSTTARNAINYVISRGCIVVAGAGNDDNSVLFYPAAYDGVIAVAATESNDKKASFSNFGSWVDVSAPGVSTKTTLQSNSYLSFSGTSGACPITAGLLGLMKSHYPQISNQSLEYCLENGADNIDNNNPNYAGLLGAGRINAENSLKCVDSMKKGALFTSVQKNNSILCPRDTVLFTLSDINNTYIDSTAWFLPGAVYTVKDKLSAKAVYLYDSSYDISVVSYNSFGKDSIYLKSYISVDSYSDKFIYFEDFDGDSSFTNIKIINPDNNRTWTVVKMYGEINSGNKAIYMPFSNYGLSGAIDEFILPPVDLSNVENPILAFDHGFSLLTKKPLSNDSLFIFASIDSGKTFNYKLFGKSLRSLQTAGAVNGPFSVYYERNWCFGDSNNCISISLDTLAGKKNVFLKFVSYYDTGNNLYIDNIKIHAKCKDVYISPPITSFSLDDSVICKGDSVRFINKSILGPKLLKWNFSGGTPDTSSQQNPVIKYNTPGTYDVTLITTNPLGADTLTQKNYIKVVALPKVMVDSVTHFCAGDSLYITASGADSITWYKPNYKLWYPGAILADKPTQDLTYSVKVITKEGCADSTIAKGILVTKPSNATLVKQGDSIIVFHSQGVYNLAWYLNDILLSGITQKTIKPSKTGNYKVKISDTVFGKCFITSQSLFFQFVQKPDAVEEYWVNKVSLYPNPASKQLFISGLEEGRPTAITITDMAGRRVMEMVLDTNQLDISTLTPGVYFVTLGQNGRYAVKKLLVE